MAIERTLSNPAVEVNDVSIGIVPNSLTYRTGKGNINVRAQSAGGNSITVIKTDNAETKISMVKFKLFNTETNIAYIRQWQDSVAGNTVNLSDGTFVESFREMFLITDPEVSLGADGELDVEFNGRPNL